MFYAINTGAITMSVPGGSFGRVPRAHCVLPQGLVAGYSIHGAPSLLPVIERRPAERTLRISSTFFTRA